jgi:hypothetical protein
MGGWVGRERRSGGSIGFEFARGMSARTRGGCGFSSLMKQKKKGENLLRILHRRIFFKKKSVMKCLRSKKRLTAADITTCVYICITF